MTALPPLPYHNNGTSGIEDIRAEFEHWYVCNAFDLTAEPIGSKNCDLQWRAWLGARTCLAQRDAKVAALVAECARLREFLRGIDTVLTLLRTGKHGRLMFSVKTNTGSMVNLSNVQDELRAALRGKETP